MNEILTSLPDKKFYDFICKCYPWKWGSYDNFLWKHCQDPFRSVSDFYYMKNNTGEIIALCVGRIYNYSCRGNEIKILEMMDYATDNEYRNKGLMSKLSDYIKESNYFDLSLGFSSEYLYEHVYSDLSCFQKYFTYEFNNFVINELVHEVYDIHRIVNSLNSCTNALRIKLSPEYINYIKNAPKYKKIIFLEYDSLMISIGLTEGYVQILDFSHYSTDSCLKAVSMASKYCHNVRIDFAEIQKDLEINNVAHQIREICCIGKMVNPVINDKQGIIWIPVMDRR